MTNSKKRKKLNKQFLFELFSVGIFLGLIVLGAFTAPNAFVRFFEAVRDFGLSCCYLVNDAIVPSVTSFSCTATEGFPKIWSDFITKAKAFGHRFISLDNLIDYGRWLSVSARWILVALIIVFTLSVILVMAVLVQVHSKNTDYSGNSRPLRVWLKVYVCCYLPVKRFLIQWKKFLKEHGGYKCAIICVILFYTNVFTMGIEIVSYYFYFIFSYDIFGLLTQLLKLLWDINLALQFLPLWLWIPVGIWLFDRARKAIAYRRLEKYEAKLRKFIKEREAVFMICAPMREGKTTLLTSMMMSLEKMYRADADEAIFRIKMRFPNFPWQRFQHFIANGMKRHKIYNLAGTRLLIDFLETLSAEDREEIRRPALRWLRKEFGIGFTEMPDELFGYDRKNFPLGYDNLASREKLFHAMKDFAQLYFIYRCPSSLIVSNYNIRLDNSFEDAGNYPRWKDDFFSPDRSRGYLNAHVLNQDMLRLGKQKDPSGPLNNALEFGAIAQTEIGKERGNQYDHRGQSQKDEDCNQTNDFYDANLKMWGHSATVRYIPFSRFGCDEQRPESWSANARELADIITITERSKDKILLPFFAVEEAVYLFTTWIIRKIFRTYVETGMKINGGSEACHTGREKLFISKLKCFSDRFDTAAWRTFYDEKARRSKYGINDIDTYSSLEVSRDDMKKAKSHFFDLVMKLFREKDDGGPPNPPPKAK